MNYGRSILVSKKDVAIFNFIITLKLILPYRKKLGQSQNIHGLNLTNKFVLFYCLFFCRTFAECSLGDGLILLVFYLFFGQRKYGRPSFQGLQKLWKKHRSSSQFLIMLCLIDSVWKKRHFIFCYESWLCKKALFNEQTQRRRMNWCS